MFSYGETLKHDQIRLLEPIHLSYTRLDFRIIIAERCMTPKYAAVSYTWGGGRPTESILVGGEEFPVRHNLWSCLYYTGTTLRGKRLWVDAICINQADTIEKNNQVRNMDETYRRAECVAVWLGMPRIPPHFATKASTMSPRQLKTLEVNPWRWHDNIDDLANRPYWTRVWIIQEFLLNESVVVFCGQHSIDWQSFKDMVIPLQHQKDHSLSRDADVQDSQEFAWWPQNFFRAKQKEEEVEEMSDSEHDIAAAAAATLLQARHTHKSPQFLQSLHELLLTHRRSECKDPRDKLFALLSLVTEDERQHLSRWFPNYDMSLNHVIIITLGHLIKTRYLFLPGTRTGGSGGGSQLEISAGMESDELFAAFGVANMPRRRRQALIDRASMMDYFSDGSLSPQVDILQWLEVQDMIHGCGGIDRVSRGISKRARPESRYSSLTKVTTVALISAGGIMLLWYQRHRRGN